MKSRDLTGLLAAAMMLSGDGRSLMPTNDPTFEAFDPTPSRGKRRGRRRTKPDHRSVKKNAKRDRRRHRNRR